METAPRADIYSLGVTLHQLLTGNDPTRTPFLLAPLQLHATPTLSGLEILIKQMLELDEMKRPANTAGIKQALQHIGDQPSAQRGWGFPLEETSAHYQTFFAPPQETSSPHRT